MNYFTYIHILDGIVFYVGMSKIRPPKKGCWSHGVKYERAYSASTARPKYWHDYVKGRCYEVQIVDHYETIELALEAELSLMFKYGTIRSGDGTLVNRYTGKLVFQFDMTGSRLGVYLNIAVASRKNNIDCHSLSNCLMNKGNRRSAGGFLWSYCPAPPPYYFSKKVIVQKTLSGKILKVYRSAQAAATALGKSSVTAIKGAIQIKTRTAYGFKWDKVPYTDIITHPNEAKQLALSESRLTGIR
jgi:hypothetical protein